MSISVVKLWPFLSVHRRGEGTDGDVSIRPCRSSSVPAPSIHARKTYQLEVCRAAATMTAYLQLTPTHSCVHIYDSP